MRLAELDYPLPEELIAQERLAPSGTVLVHGEYWAADSDEPVDAGERVRVTAVEGLRLRVRRA